jgi:ADP-heptose:LPS heptosyltransferase
VVRDSALDPASTERILIIRLSALGDFILALPAMAAIRRHHPSAEITLLTSAGLAELGERSGWFDRVEIDDRPGWLDIRGWWRLRRRLRAGRFDRVYDLQAQDRTAVYFRLFWPGRRPEWSGIARSASHPHRDPNRRHMHALDIHAAQLRLAGIDDLPQPDLRWIDDPALGALGLPPRFALLVPGSAAHRPGKRWPTDRYGELARRLADEGIVPVIVGNEAERDLAAAIRADCPDALDLTGRTSLFAIGGMARRAVAAIGNDTGPMHLAAMVGCRSVVLFSAASNPVRAAPRGANVTILRRNDLADLPVDAVAAAVKA